MEGKVAFADDGVTVDGKKVAWGDVLAVAPDPTGKALPTPTRVRLRNGESWPVEVLRLEKKTLTVRSELFGEKTVNTDALLAIDFATQSAGVGKRAALTLYRAKGKPVPGALLGITADKVKVESPFGELDLPRDGLQSYVLADAAPVPPANLNELALIDGSLLRGKLRPGAEALVLEHPQLGTLKPAVGRVRSVVRHPANVIDLTELAPAAVRTLPLLGVADAQAASYRTTRGAPLFVKGLVIEPKTVVRYKLPATDAKTVQLRARLLPIDGARGDVRVTVRAGTAKWEGTVAAGGKPAELVLDLPAGAEVELEIDFGEALRFPCGVVLADPYIVAVKP